jgi:hypothetical protein
LVLGVPTVSGTAQAGEVLTADPDSDGWSPGAKTFAYQWYADGAAISGAKSADIVLTGDLVGADLFVEVTAVASGYAPTSVASAPVAVLVGVFSVVGVPTVSGTAQAGEALTADPDPDGWTPVADGFAYQWYADGAAISGATGRSFLITSSQVGTNLTVTVIASRFGWLDATAMSAPSQIVTASATMLADTGASIAAVIPLGSAIALLIGALLFVGRRRQRADAEVPGA